MPGHRILVKVVSGHPSGAGMGAEGGGGEQELPAPLAGGVGVFAQQGFGEMNIARADGQILQVFLAGGIKMIAQGRFQGPG